MLKLKVRAHVIVSGRVQGVYFRGFTRNEAQKYDVKGWVRNLPDGRVEAILEGEKKEVDKVINSLNKGPSYSKVKDLNVDWLDYTDDFNAFQIRY
ncbi:MAG: acylphosphatase [Methanobacterium sp.]